MSLNGRSVLIAVLGTTALAIAGVEAYARYRDYTDSLQAPPAVAAPNPPIVAGPPQVLNVAALGRIEPESEIVNLAAGVSPGRLDVLLVKRGDPVHQDQVLGYLGGYPEQIAQRDVFSAQLAEAKARMKAETALDQSRLAAAKISRQQVLDVTPLRIAAQEATIASLNVKLSNDKKSAERLNHLVEHGNTSRQAADDQNSLVAQEVASLKAAEAQLEELRQQFEADKQNADAQVEIAQNTLARMQVDFPIDSLEREMVEAEAAAKQLTLLSPIDGRVLDVRVKPGEEVGTGPILVLGETEHMRAVAEVYETDIARVRIGQEATISSRALTEPIEGKVVRIGDMVFKNDVLNVDPAARADARVVQVWIDLDSPAAVRKLTNLTVDVLIHTPESDPAQASNK